MADKGIQIAKGYVQIVPTARGIEGSIEKVLSPEAQSAGEKGGITIGNNLVSTLKRVVVAAGIGKFIQSAMSEGGKLQQSYGGLETIYGDAAEQAKKFAEQAYTAGISANDYAEQAVSFGASLKQAFGGDTAAAVEAANTAIMDMTDNAAKMGTPIESIQHAYQGFAKQNYTMLDNLKLGYGGTKTEMERLLADAQQLSGVEYDISNLGDVYEAIHVIQGELGLTGVAASEASNTFTGSMGAMNAALSNFLGALTTGADIEGPLLAVIGNAGVFIQNNLFPMILSIINALPTVISTAVPALISAIEGIIKQITNTLSTGGLASGKKAILSVVDGITKQLPSLLKTGGDVALKLINSIGEKAPQMINTAASLINDFLKRVLSELPNILNTGANVVTKLAEGLRQAIPGVVAAAGQAIADFLNTILTNLPQIVDSGINMLTKLAEGMNNNTQALIYAVANAMKNIVSTIVQHLPEIIESGIKILSYLATGIVRQVPHVITTIGALVTDIVRSFLEYDWGSLGERILEGIARGLRAGVSIVVDAAKNTARSAFEAAKDFLGIESPSKLFRDEVGAMMAEGMAIGFEDNVPTAEIENALEPMASVVPDTMGGGQYSYGGFTINVYGAPGQDINALADIIGDRINASIRRQEAVFA